MPTILSGPDTAARMKERLTAEVDSLKAQGIVPTLAIVRIGERPDDLAYERGAMKRMEAVGIHVEQVILPADISQADLEARFRSVNEDEKVHGILLFQPLPKPLDVAPLKAAINPVKDVDGMCDVNIAKVFAGDDSGYAPCTPEAVMTLLEANDVALSGKRVTVVGRSMVVGKPLAMLMLKQNATVTICHTRTADLAATCRQAEILVAAAGKAKMITADMVGEQAIVVDVGINLDQDGNLCGDVDYDNVADKTAAISPVPGGVGSVTTSVLAAHVLRAARTLHHLS